MRGGRHRPATGGPEIEGASSKRRQRDRERLQAAAEQLLSSEGWQRWVRARASNGLARYSLSNQLLVALQSDGGATFVAGFHELAHGLGLGYSQYGRTRAEVLVDCVTYVVCSSAGLDVGSESIPYVAGGGEDGALDAIREYAKTIDEIARRIEDASSDGCDATAEQAA